LAGQRKLNDFNDPFRASKFFPSFFQIFPWGGLSDINGLRPNNLEMMVFLASLTISADRRPKAGRVRKHSIYSLFQKELSAGEATPAAGAGGEHPQSAPKSLVRSGFAPLNGPSPLKRGHKARKRYADNTDPAALRGNGHMHIYTYVYVIPRAISNFAIRKQEPECAARQP
jgi:hypothetical protein